MRDLFDPSDKLPPAGIADDELRWFFSVHDGKWASPYLDELEAQRHPDLPETDAFEKQVYWVLRKRIVRLGDHDAGVLMAAYAPRPWPPRLRRTLGRLTGVVVRLVSAGSDWPPDRPTQDVLEVRVARQLELALAVFDRDVFAAYRTSARALLGRALRAYLAERDANPPAVWAGA